MTDHHDAQDYTANGPTDVGFRTVGPNFTKGVEVFGTAVGVHGIGTGTEDSSAVSTGIVGEGGEFGVRGFSTNATGVYGHSDKGTGVQGQGVTGIKGVSIDVGIMGVSGESLNGVGVDGVSKNWSGVHGKSTIATGVFGESESGWGVHGLSTASYGGVFQSNFAQIRLVPASSVGQPSKGQHYGGELFVDAIGTLFYCVADGTPGSWVELARRSLFREFLRTVITSVGKVFGK